MQCSICGEKTPEMKRCSKCKKKLYCSRECQVSDWPTHRNSCFPPPPSSQSFLSTASTTRQANATSVPKTITITHNKVPYDVILNDGMTGKEIMAEISRKLRVPEEKLKLISRGEMLTYQNSYEKLFNEKSGMKIMAFGEQMEIEDDLHTGDINTIVLQTKVDRNTAIRALRKCDGNLVDALLLVG